MMQKHGRSLTPAKKPSHSNETNQYPKDAKNAATAKQATNTNKSKMLRRFDRANRSSRPLFKSRARSINTSNLTRPPSTVRSAQFYHIERNEV